MEYSRFSGILLELCGVKIERTYNNQRVSFAPVEARHIKVRQQILSRKHDIKRAMKRSNKIADVLHEFLRNIQIY